MGTCHLEMVVRIAVAVSPFLDVAVLPFLDVAVLPFLDGASTVRLFYKKCNLSLTVDILKSLSNA